MADILIRGMENIPVGLEFVIVENIDFERYLYNRETGAAFHLVPLQKGHGRLTDADEIADQAVEIAQKTEGSVEKWAMLFAAELVRNSPTIIEADGGGDDG